MKLHKYSQLRFGLVLGIGAVVALLLCVQCVRTYLYTDTVLVPKQAAHEAERQAGALTAAARSAGITDPRKLGAVIEHTMESASDRVLWMRMLDRESNLLAGSGKPERTVKIPARWWENIETHEGPGAVVDTAHGKVFVATPHFGHRGHRPVSMQGSEQSASVAGNHRPPGYVVELAVPLKAVAGTFDGLGQNLIVGLIASMALLASLLVIGLRAPHYFRGKYLESELQLARRVQGDLEPKPHSVSEYLEFAASAVAADQVGGDFHDIFEAESGRFAIVLGDVSGKGIPAALLVSVLHGAIRSSTTSQHEHACERINRMLCERTAGERFATLFWGVFDPVTNTLRYVNAGHAAPMLIREGQNRIEDEAGGPSEAKRQTIRLDEGGPVLGLLPGARYSAGTVKIESSDTLILYSDGITEATNRNEEEFGEQRIEDITAGIVDASAAELCERIMSKVTVFASAGTAPDDRTLLVVRFPQSGAAQRHRKSEGIGVQAVA